MNVTSSGIINGVIQPQYGGHGTQFNENGIPAYSLPFTVEDAPQGTVSIAVVLEDKDAYCNAALYSRQKKHFIFDSINTITAHSFR